MKEIFHREPGIECLPEWVSGQFSNYYPPFQDINRTPTPDRRSYHNSHDKIELTTLEAVPKPAIDEFFTFAQKGSDNPNPHNNQPENFNAFFVIPHKEKAYTTWVGWHTRISMDWTGWHHKSNFYLCDLTKDNTLIGQSHVSYTMMSNEPYDQNPSEHWNGTELPFVGNGYGTNRLLMMNALSLTFWEVPMRSDLYLMGKAEGHVTSEELLWKKFVKQGIAKPYILQENQHYIFIPEAIAGS